MTNNNPPICLKIRGGVEVDSYGKKAGKGALLSENLSMTLGVSQDQYLFQPVAYGVVTKGNGDAFLNEKTHTSLSVGGGQAGQGYPCVLQAFGLQPIFFEAYQHHGWRQNNVAGTLTAGQNDRVRGDTPIIVSETGGNGDGKITATITGVHEHSISDYTNVIVLRLDNGSAYPVVCGDKSPTIRRGNGPGGTGHVAVCFQQNQRDEVRIMEKPGATTAQPGMKCQNFIAEVINLNKDDVQSKAVIDPRGIAPALYAGECRGGGGELYICLEGNGSRPSHRGDGYKVDDKMYTLNTIDRHAVRYGISSMGSNAMLSDNPHSGIYEAKTSRTLDLNGGNPACNQGGIIVCQYWDGTQTTGTLTANNAGGSQRMPDKENFNCVIQRYPKSIHDFVAENNSDAPHQQDLLQTADGVGRTLAASTHGAAPHLTKTVIRMDNQYIVRRLTPTECCRLQGFPDGWGEIDPKEDFTDEEYLFWLEVRNTHAAINGKKVGNYTKDQMLTWYNKLHSDSNEYKMWGNGIALPNALYVMEGIAEELEKMEVTKGNDVRENDDA